MARVTRVLLPLGAAGVWLIVMLLLGAALGSAGSPFFSPQALAGGTVLVFLALMGAVGTAALAVLSASLWPGPTGRSRTALSSLPLRCLLLGLLVVTAEAALVYWTGSGAIFVLLALLHLVWLFQGYPGLAMLVGRRAGIESHLWAAVGGTLLLALACTPPLVGWALAFAAFLAATGAALVGPRLEV